MPKSKKDLNVERFPKLTDALAKDKEFCSIVGHSSPDCAERLDAIIKNIAPTVEYTRLHTQFLRTLLFIWQGLTFVSIACDDVIHNNEEVNHPCGNKLMEETFLDDGI